MLALLGRCMYRMRWVILVIILLLVGLSAFYGTSVFGLLKSGGFDDPQSESTHAANILNAQLGGATADVVILMQSDTLSVKDAAFTAAATHLLSTLQQRPEVAAVTSYYSTHDARFLARNGHETFATLQLRAKDQAEQNASYLAIRPLITSPILHITIGGNVPANLVINSQVSTDIEHAEITTGPILAVLLFFVFDSMVAALLPLLMGGIAMLGAFVVLRVLASFTDVSIFAINIITMLSIGLGIDYALFIVTRFREELALQENDVQAAIERTMSRAGHTVLFSGLTVSMCLLSLLLFPQLFLRSMGIGAIATILVVLLAALTFLPAALSILGKHVNALSIVRLLRRSSPRKEGANAQGAWYRFSEIVMRWPAPIIVAGLIILMTLGYPFLHVAFTVPDINVLPANQPVRVVSDRLTSDFDQSPSQITIAVQTNGDALSASNLAGLMQYVQEIEQISGVQHIDSLVTMNPSLSLLDYQQGYAHLDQNPQLTPVVQQFAHGNVTKIVVGLRPQDNTAAAQKIVRQVRALQKPAGLSAWVYGVTPVQMDILSSLSHTLPYALALIAAMIFILLFLMTNSLLIPIKAIILNVCSLTATFGGLVWIFQDGHLQHLLDFQPVGGIDATQLVLIFAIAFGLSMDYEVFLLSRMKEQYDLVADNRAAVAGGLQKTGWLITSAAILLAIVLGAFGMAKIIFIKEVGIGLAIAVIMDATLIRMLLVPATMRLLGSWNWWTPALLRSRRRGRILEKPAVEGA